MTHVTAGCVCGAVLDEDVSGSLDDTLDRHGAFQALHTGPGHGACDVDTARRAVRRAKRPAYRSLADQALDESEAIA